MVVAPDSCPGLGLTSSWKSCRARLPNEQKAFIPIYPNRLPNVPKPPNASRTSSLVFKNLPASQGNHPFAKPFGGPENLQRGFESLPLQDDFAFEFSQLATHSCCRTHHELAFITEAWLTWIQNCGFRLRSWYSVPRILSQLRVHLAAFEAKADPRWSEPQK